MSVYAGPKIENDGILLCIDGNNQKSINGNDVTNIITGETHTGSIALTNGYIYTNSNAIDKYTVDNMSSAQNIAVFTKISNLQDTKNIKGLLFLVNSKHNQNDFGIALPQSHSIFNVSCTNEVSYSNSVNTSNTSTPLAHNVFTSNSISTINYHDIPNISSIITVDSNNIILITNVANSVIYNDTYSPSNTFTVSQHQIFNVAMTNITTHYFNNNYELSIFSDGSSIIVRNKQPTYDSTLSHDTSYNETNSCLVNFGLGNAENKIELYINNLNVLNSGNMSSSGTINTSEIQLFSVDGVSDFLQTGLNNITVYNKKLYQDDIELFRNLKGN